MLVTLQHPEQETNLAFQMEQFLDFLALFYIAIEKEPIESICKGEEKLGRRLAKLLHSSRQIRFVELNKS